MVIVYPEISFAFQREGHAGVFCQSVEHLQPKRSKEMWGFPQLSEKMSYVVEESDPGRNADFLLDPEGVAGIGIEVYGYVYFGFVGHPLDLRDSWLGHQLGPVGCAGEGI